MHIYSKIFDVDYIVMVLSGHRLVSAYSGGDKQEDGIISHYYEKISRNQHYEGDWDFENNQHDLIFINDILLIDSKVNDLEFSLKFKIPNDSEKIPKIRVMLLSENQNGGIGIKKIKINSCSEDENIICPTEKKNLVQNLLEIQ